MSKVPADAHDIRELRIKIEFSLKEDYLIENDYLLHTTLLLLEHLKDAGLGDKLKMALSEPGVKYYISSNRLIR